MNKLVYTLLETDWGYAVAVWSGYGLWKMSFPRTELKDAFVEISNIPAVEGRDEVTGGILAEEMQRYFRGERVNFSTPIDWTGYTPFQTAVLRHTAMIGYCETVSYGHVATAIGSPRAARAVGGALHINRTPIVIPCHRVLGANGSLTGFGGGLDMKQALLRLERGEK